MKSNTIGNKLPGLLLPADWFAMLLSLDDATLAALIRAAIRYADTRTDTDQHGPTQTDAGTEAMGLKAKAAPLWLIMRAEIDRQIQKRQKAVADAKRAINTRWDRQKSAGPNLSDTTEYDRIRPYTTVYDRIRPYGGDNPAPENTDQESHKSRNDNDNIRTYTTVYERIRTNTRGGGRAGGEGTVLSSTKSLSEKENLQEKAGVDEANGANGADGANGHRPTRTDPDGHDRPDRKARVVRILMHYIRRHYHRRKSTVWSAKEMSQVRAIAMRPDVIRELRVIGRAYRGGYQYARHDIITLLNNWTTELDRAEKYNTNNTKTRRSHGGGIEARYGMQ